MNILHISDFHYKGDTRHQERVLEAIISAIKRIGKPVHFILFTGDLVDKGSVQRYFPEAKSALFDKLSEGLGVLQENIIICAGNHDINQDEVHPAIHSYFTEKIQSNDNLNDFYHDKNKMFHDSLAPLHNFRDFLGGYHPASDKDIHKELYSIHFRSYNDRKIAFVCVSSPWLCNLDLSKGKNDYGNMVNFS